jgi:hypothetical protein
LADEIEAVLTDVVLAAADAEAVIVESNSEVE